MPFIKKSYFVRLQKNRINEAAQRFQYALKKLTAYESGSDKEWRDVKFTVLLNLAQCLRKLRVCHVLGISSNSTNF